MRRINEKFFILILIKNWKFIKKSEFIIRKLVKMIIRDIIDIR